MTGINTAAVHEHEIAKHDDFQYGFEGIIRNTAVLDRMLVSADTDYIVGGTVSPAADSLAIHIGKLWGNGRSLDLPIFNDAPTPAIPLSPPVEADRIDTLQVQGALETFDVQYRAFFNPETEGGEYSDTPTKKRLVVKWALLPGVEGQEQAPDTEAGWLKLAEILVSPGMTEIEAEQIRGVTALYQGEENTAWTNERNRTFQLGSDLQLKGMLFKEHTLEGKHREKVIHGSTIDFGIGGDQVNAQKIPLGKSYEAGTGTLSDRDSIFVTLMKLDDILHRLTETIADMVHEAPQDGSAYARKNRSWVEVLSGGAGTIGDAIEAFKFYSKKTVMLTNARIVDRRNRGWDIGLPYLSPGSRVYHFDTDVKDHRQQSQIEIRYTGDAPVLAGAEDTNGAVYFNPAVSALPPYEMKGRSLYGFFSLKTLPQTATATYTAEAWIRLLDTRPAVILCFDLGMERLTLRLGTKGSLEPAYSAPGEGEIPYSTGETLEYSVAEPDEIAYSEAETDGIAYSREPSISYSEGGTDPGNRIIHEWSNGSETIDLDEAGMRIPYKTWIHIAAVVTPSFLGFYIGTEQILFQKRSQSAVSCSLVLNPGMREFNLDELLLDEGTAAGFADFSANTENRIPYAALDYRKKWFVLEAQDPALVKTNLFESEAFRTAVRSLM